MYTKNWLQYIYVEENNSLIIIPSMDTIRELERWINKPRCLTIHDIMSLSNQKRPWYLRADGSIYNRASSYTRRFLYTVFAYSEINSSSHYFNCTESIKIQPTNNWLSSFASQRLMDVLPQIWQQHYDLICKYIYWYDWISCKESYKKWIEEIIWPGKKVYDIFCFTRCNLQAVPIRWTYIPWNYHANIWLLDLSFINNISIQFRRYKKSFSSLQIY